MRIGKFGKENNLSIDTIRHYMDLGLIVPEKKGGQYEFDENCQKDLELILEFKGMGFSLNEIKTIFHYKSFGNLTDYETELYYQSLFLNKVEKVEQEIKDLQNISHKLKGKIDQLAAKSLRERHSTGIDLSVLNLLCCHKCHEPLTLLDGTISRNQIMDGKLSCECGEVYLIESGILIVGNPVRPESESALANSVHEYIQETDPTFLENLNISLHVSKRKLHQIDLHKKVLLELGTGVGFFLRNILQELPEDCLYIAVDHNLERHQFLKSLLERSDFKRKILFICADFLEIPIPNQTVDILIDSSGTSNYSFKHEAFLLREVDHLIKREGYLLGSYLTFKNFSPKSKIASEYRDHFMVNKIRKKIAELGYETLDERLSEPIDRGGRFEDFFVQGEEIYSYLFFGKRWG
ncbi:MerR family transcriptional regulator [Bacillus sp. JJ1764]|uniref:MerR family transcriptional regulator n=1 Tax=Bacillus sp. JJ1764 TaxID=3122964 RepID=UPI002FFE66BD